MSQEHFCEVYVIATLVVAFTIGGVVNRRQAKREWQERTGADDPAKGDREELRRWTGDR